MLSSIAIARKLKPTSLLLILCWAPALWAQEPVDTAAIRLIREEGLERSQVMETVFWLTDVYGPRLTGSPQLDSATAWAMRRLESWGLANVHRERWGPFGRGWSLEHVRMEVTAPVRFPVLAYPKAWSPSIDGPVTAEVVRFDVEDTTAFATYQGKLQGKIVLLEPPRALKEPFEPLARRRDAEDLLSLANAPASGSSTPRYSTEVLRQRALAQRRLEFLYQERPLAILDRGYRGDYGTVFVDGADVPTPAAAFWDVRFGPWATNAQVIPQFTVAAEHYNRIYRLLERGFRVEMTVDLKVAFHEEDPYAYNLIAELPGADPEIGDELVMLGAHFDSWHAGTGATDNAAGSAVMMEAMRILKTVYDRLGRKPRRTIRLALWTGEEQGLLGSRAYVNQHFAELGSWGQPPRRLKPAHEKFSVYFNLDNGAGKIRGIYTQGNEAVVPIFRAWLAPFHDLGAATVSLRNTGGTDHLSFDAAGLPGFQFIQDHLAYGTRTHHSNMDVFDHLIEDDLKQAATIIAAFAYHAAERDARLPRKPLPQPENTP
ncbi:Leupeptin-inactivating enzyme 1 [bacterium HR18]|uniref:Carboxypeptidase Q n=1 Tax=Rhodothermus marinus TaxID=29549 RepID=A0A7V2AYI3_RHOMR|nr:Leupeptin-inactivating enzyme 1 [bacterium HR18]